MINVLKNSKIHGLWLTFLFYFLARGGSAKELLVDIAQSEISWTGKKLTGQHTGKVAFVAGAMTWVDGRPIGGKFVLGV